MLVVDRLDRESGQRSFQRLYMKRDTRLPTVVEWTSGIIPIKTVLWLHLTVNKKSQISYTQQATLGTPLKMGPVCCTNTYLGTN